jgi:hypothetical protein
VSVDDWVFRHAAGCVIEFPPLHLPPPPSGANLRAWVATWWRDPTRPSGWELQEWAKADRGWRLPAHLAVGDVLEFGLVACSVQDGRALDGYLHRWYGWLRYCNDLAVVVEGPHRDPVAAEAAAHSTVYELRLRQLPSPAPDPAWREMGGDVETER